MENEIRELLRGRADIVRAPLEAPQPVLRRARRRRVATGAVSALVLAGVVAAAIVGTRALLAPNGAPSETRLGGPDAQQFAVWPQTTREDAEAAQRCVDAGREECMWQLNALEVVRRYGESELGWDRVFVFVEGFTDRYWELPLEGEVDIGLTDVVDPLTVRITECFPPQIEERECEAATLTVKKPLRPDVTGVWLITRAQHGTYEVAESPPPSPRGPGSGRPPSPLENVEQGGRYWAVYVAVARYGSPELADAADRMERGDYAYSEGDITCDPPAAAELGVPETFGRVAVYFTSRGDAEAFAASLDPPARGIAQVQTYCLD